MARYSDTVRDQNNVPIIGALVTVLNQDGTTPTLTDDDGNTLVQPLTTDGYGSFYFNTADGFYDLSFFYGGRLVTKELGVQVPSGAAPPGLVPLVYNLGALTASGPLTDLSETWDNSGVDFIGERRQITGTAYGVNSVAYTYLFNGVPSFTLGPKGWLKIGDRTVSSTDAGAATARDLFDGSTSNAHGFVHADRIRRSGLMASASYDAFPQYEANSYDHDASFQSRPNFQLNGGATVTNAYGLYSQPSMDTGTITNRYGTYAAAPILTNGGAVTNNYGNYVESLTTGTNNWAYYSAGLTKSAFGGSVFIGTTTDSLPLNPGLLIGRNLFDGLTGNAHGASDTTLYRRSGSGAYASFDAKFQMQGFSYDHCVGFQARPSLNFSSSGQVITNIYGVYDQPSIDTGTGTNRYGCYVANPILTNGGKITNHYGLYVDTLTAGTSLTYSIYAAGTAPSYLGGALTVGGAVTLPGNPTNPLEAAPKQYVDAASKTDVQVFTSSGTWTKPTGAKTVRIIVVGGGGGGGAGGVAGAGVATSGGGGGGGGAGGEILMDASALGSTETVTVGAGGTAGAAGGNSSFGAWLTGYGGGGGSVGGTTGSGGGGGAGAGGAGGNGSPGTGGTAGTYFGAAGGGGSVGAASNFGAAGGGGCATAGTASAGGQSGSVGPSGSGGGSGGGVSSGDVGQAGGAGGATRQFPTGTAGSAAGVAGVSPAAASSYSYGGAGASGGGGSASANGGAGAAGALPGGGGSGGGAARTGFAGGAGGVGGAGRVIVLTQL